MTVTYLPNTQDVHDPAVKQNFEYLESHALFTDDNLASIVNASTARTNLGLGTAAVVALTSLLQAANNLSDVANAATARTNLGLGGALTDSGGTARKFTIGTATTAAPSPAGTETPLLMVNHGLGVLPSVVLLTCIGGAYGNTLVPRWDSTVDTNTQFGVRVESNAAFNSAVGVAWVAIS